MFDASPGGPLARHLATGGLRGPRVCPQAAQCPVQSVWVDATQVLDDYLASVRFDALAQRSEAHQPAHLRVQAIGRLRSAHRGEIPKASLAG